MNDTKLVTAFCDMRDNFQMIAEFCSESDKNMIDCQLYGAYLMAMAIAQTDQEKRELNDIWNDWD